MTLISDWLNSQAQACNAEKSIDVTDIRLLVCHLLSQNTAWLLAHQHDELTDAQTQQLNQWVEELKVGKPLAYITGEKEFWNLKLKVNRHTLIPRPETELMIETTEALNLQPKKILDLGTGSGAIALALATLFPKAEIIATDVSLDALETAKENAKLNQISNVEFIQSDWFSRISPMNFNLIVSNPPYIAVDDEHLAKLTHEPNTALVASNNGLAAYHTICKDARSYLQTGGVLMFEHGWQQHQDVAEIMSVAGFTDICHEKDLLGHFRITWGKADFKT